ncbi:MAG TPA: SpoIID/LytB domain-containing protein, partial [Allocoleopsis sp.]
MVFCILGLTGASEPVKTLTDFSLKIGIIQRFGQNDTDKITIEATTGDQLVLNYLGNDMQPKTMQTNSIKLEIQKFPLAQPELQERVVLGNYRSFETAEDGAKKWREQKIEVEIAQPDKWQVWAKRSVYKTALLRRSLIENIKQQGNNIPYLDTKLVNHESRLTWQVGGTKFNQKVLDISSRKNQIKITKNNGQSPSIIYAGNLRIQPNSYSDFTIVNQVGLEDYLRGVVPHEINAGAPQEAQEAQSIIARTYVLRNLRRFAVDSYNLCADAQCQMYLGLAGASKKSDRAIAATKGLVLTYNNQLVDALYSSTTGGITAPFNDVWNGENRPYLQAVIDGKPQIWNLALKNLSSEENLRNFINLKEGFNEKNWDTFRWNKFSTLDEIKDFLKLFLTRTKATLQDFNQIKQIKVLERSASGRILKLEVETERGVIEILKDDVRSAFKAPVSTLFYLEPVYNADNTLKGYSFIGGGLGHGVGLSQTGAYTLAQQGWNSGQILQFYY